VRVARRLRFVPGTILVMDRGYLGLRLVFAVKRPERVLRHAAEVEHGLRGAGGPSGCQAGAQFDGRRIDAHQLVLEAELAAVARHRVSVPREASPITNPQPEKERPNDGSQPVPEERAQAAQAVRDRRHPPGPARYARTQKLTELDLLDLVLQDEIARRDHKNLSLRLAQAGFDEDHR